MVADWLIGLFFHSIENQTVTRALETKDSKVAPPYQAEMQHKERGDRKTTQWVWWIILLMLIVSIWGKCWMIDY